MGLQDDDHGALFYITFLVYFLLGLCWCAVQVLSIVQGARFLSTAFCNQDLAIYLLISGIFPIALALVAVAAPYVQRRHYNNGNSSKLSTEQMQYKAPPSSNPQQVKSGAISSLRWRTPRSTCHEMNNPGGCAVRHYVDLEDHLPPPPWSPPGSSDHFIYERDTWICQEWAKECWRQLSGRYALNGLYSPVPLTAYTRSPEARSAWKCLNRLVYALGILLGLAYVGWLIFGTVITSKSGVESCVAELYHTALALVIVNWVSPVVTLILAAWGLIMVF